MSNQMLEKLELYGNLAIPHPVISHGYHAVTINCYEFETNAKVASLELPVTSTRERDDGWIVCEMNGGMPDGADEYTYLIKIPAHRNIEQIDVLLYDPNESITNHPISSLRSFSFERLDESNYTIRIPNNLAFPPPPPF